MQSSKKNLKINISPLNIKTFSDDIQENLGNPMSPFTESMTELEKEIKNLQDTNNKQTTKIAVLEKSNQASLKLHEDEKLMISRLKNLLNDEEKIRIKHDQHIKSLLSEIETLKKIQASPQDKVLAEAKIEVIKEKSRADSLARDNKDLTLAYERASKEIADKKRELQHLQQENYQLKKSIHDLNKQKADKSPSTTASVFFSEKKPYNKDERPPLDSNTFEI